MTKLLISAMLGLLLFGDVLHLGADQALAADSTEKTVTLAVRNMYCADCPFIVKKSVERVPGVAKAVVSYKDKTAVVTYDDSKTMLPALIKATTDAGYPSAPKD
jgi:mercuric ion binding protein